MTIDYELLWLQNTFQGFFSQMLTVENVPNKNFYNPIRHIYLNKVLHNKELKGGISACYETWFYEYL